MARTGIASLAVAAILTLAPAAAVAVELLGLIEDSAGEPLAAKVTVSSLERTASGDSLWVREGRADGTGRFRLGIGDNVDARVEISHEGFVTVLREFVDLEARAQLGHVALEPARMLSVTTRWLPDPGNEYVVSIATGCDPIRQWCPRARAPLTNTGAAVLAAPRQVAAIELAGSGEFHRRGVTGDDVEIDRRGAELVEIKIVDRRGEPVFGSIVSLGLSRGFVGRTDHQGSLAITYSCAPECDELAVQAVSPTGLRGQSILVGRGPASIQVGTSRTVVGRVVDAGGRPVSEANLKLREGKRVRRTGTTDADGGFVLPDIVDGLYDLVIMASGFARATSRVAIAEAGPALDLGEVELSDGLAVIGYVVNESREPVVDAEIMLATATDAWVAGPTGRPQREVVATSDTTGAFRLDALAPDRLHRFQIWAVGFVPTTFDVTDSDAVMEVVLEPAIELRGRVIDESGQPVNGAIVAVSRDREEEQAIGTGHNARVYADADGLFSVPYLRPGKVDLVVISEQHLKYESPRLELTAGESQELEIVLEHGVTVRGEVTNQLGEPIAGASVQTAWSGVPGTAELLAVKETETDEEGAFALHGVALAPLRLRARHSDYGETERTVTVVRDATFVRIELDEGERAVVRGRALDASGVPLSGVEVSFVDTESRRVFHTIAGRESAFRIELDPASYLIRTGSRGLRVTTPEEAIDVLPGGLDGLTVEFSAGTTIRGSISGLPGAESGGLQIWAYGPGTRRGRLVSPTAYKIEALVPGDWRVVGLARSGRSAAIEITVGEEPRIEAVELDFSAGYRVSGRVEVDGEVLAGAIVRLDIREAFAPGMAQRTDTAGRFDFGHVARGNYLLEVMRPNSEQVLHRMVAEVDGNEHLEIRIENPGLTTPTNVGPQMSGPRAVAQPVCRAGRADPSATIWRRRLS